MNRTRKHVLAKKILNKVETFRNAGHTGGNGKSALPHYYCGREVQAYILGHNDVMVPYSSSWSLEEQEYETQEEMFMGADAIFFNARWHFTDLLGDEEIAPRQVYREKLKSGLEELTDGRE